ncbi:hypothetical protein NE237_006012 [Protea cynaroides]|uniref:Protein kinase domain-containing protein n=1 Tax=Protea cynaroides TaxID=273540 RepID=A0A9Q0QUX1_9MAGN|nr:hypothetical protein NE237_006012 [Protea cynaroides]
MSQVRPDHDQFRPCPQAHLCGKVNISSPFFNYTQWEYCGLESLRCLNGSTPVLFRIGDDSNEIPIYEIQSIDYSNNTILAHDQRFTGDFFSQKKICNTLFNNFTMPPIFHHLSAELISPNLTLTVCKHHQELNDSVGKDCKVEVLPNADATPAPRPRSNDSSYECKLVQLPVDVPPSKFHGPVDPVSQLFTPGFRLRWSLPNHVISVKRMEPYVDSYTTTKLMSSCFLSIQRREGITEKLRNGQEVAVKRLYENNCKRVKQFMNEVGILGRLRHPNLVTLCGCTSRYSHELLLVYEFIPNGTVADHLHGDRTESGSLPWPTRMSIAIETVQALTYLHASDIIHRDVKTNNILLDQNFHVKVANFGLSRLFPTEVTSPLLHRGLQATLIHSITSATGLQKRAMYIALGWF